VTAPPTESPLVALELSGRLDATVAAAVSAAYARLLDGVPGPATVVLDFTAVDYINSSGIAVVVGVLGRARAAGHTVVALGLTPHYRHVFEITRLSDFLTVADDLATVADHAPIRRVAVPPPGRSSS
jgi:anti-anti-sigma factor